MSSTAGRIVVFGGNGFVGSKVLERLVRMGLPAASVSRSGLPPKHASSWSQSVEWVKGDASTAGDKGTSPEIHEKLQDASAVVIAVGSPPLPFVDYNHQKFMNGDTCSGAIRGAALAGVKKVVLVSATMPDWCPKGYADGKKQAAQAARDFAAEDDTRTAVILKPGAIYGTRHTQGGTPIPLGAVMGPASWVMQTTAVSSASGALMRALPGVFGGVLLPPVHVGSVAAAAVEACTDDSLTGKITELGVHELLKFSKD